MSSAVKDRQPDAASMRGPGVLVAGSPSFRAGRAGRRQTRTRCMLRAISGACVTSTRLVPSSRLSSSMSSNTPRALRPSRLPVGSSASTSLRARHERARDRGALPLAARQLRRPVREPRAEPDAFERSARPLPRFSRRHAPHEQRHRHVLERGELGQQMMELVDEAERAVAQLAALPRRQSSSMRLAGDATRVRSSADRARPGSAAASSCRSPTRRRSPRVSPARPADRRPCSTSSRCARVLEMLAHAARRSRTPASVMPQRPRGIGPCRAPGGIERRQAAERKGRARRSARRRAASTCAGRSLMR